MGETKLPRLSKAATEFNIGRDTLIEFLESRGFDTSRPHATLSIEMYLALQSEFHGDKVAKKKADQVEIPKVGAVEKKKKDEVIENLVPIVNNAAIDSTLFANETSSVSEKALPKVPETIITKIATPALSGPKIITKVDLDAVNRVKQPKKTAKKKEEPDAVTDKTISSAPKEKADTKEITTDVEELEMPNVESAPIAVIENIRADRITGPTILGKITLPINEDTRPKPMSEQDRRKRKRIVKPNEAQAGKPAMGSRMPRLQGQGQPSQPQGDRRAPYQGGGRPQANKYGNTGARPPYPPRADREIDKKEIQDKIRETQARLSGMLTGRKGSKSKYRRAKREEAAATENMEDNNGAANVLQVTEFVTVSELANLMNINFTDIISKCMQLGVMVSINQRLDAEIIELVANEFKFEVSFIELNDAIDSDDKEEEFDDDKNQITRSPVITIMGHVDHGKTSLLDYIRETNVVAGESGGITQHIGAYVVKLPNGKHITFLDTPGHEAFTAMRARGTKITDLAVIVIAADDAVMPQTKEAISHAQAANVPMIFAINKIDKPGANPQKIYEQLAAMNLLVESWGGKYQSQEIAAKQGTNVSLLLEKILLESDLLELKANPNRPAKGTIIEASLDNGRGYMATVLIQNGTLRQGDVVVSGPYYGKVKAMFNERNQPIKEAPPSTPALVLGLSGAPQAGERFKTYLDASKAKETASNREKIMREQGLRAKKHITLDEIGRRLALGNFKELKIIIKGDVDGSVEALSDSLQKLSTPEIAIGVVHTAVGQISESDVLLAAASDAILIGFNVRPSVQAVKLAQNEGVEIKMYSIIYTAIEELKSAMEGMLTPMVQEKEVATIEIREVYKFDKATVAGCYVQEGKVKREQKIRLFRDGILIYPRQEGGYAELGSLKRFKDDVKEVNSGYECGLTVKGFTDLHPSDTIVVYEEEEVKRTL